MNSSKRRLAWTLATWFGCGRSPVAPGTIGTLGAIPLYLLAAQGGRGLVAVVALLVTGVGVWAGSSVARELGNHDPQVVVIDEVAGFLVTMLPMPAASWRAIAVGFVVFRVLDAVKPWPIRWFERLPGGFGVVFDDLAAGAAGAAILIVFRALEFLR